jgi:hypothetical protein
VGWGWYARHPYLGCEVMGREHITDHFLSIEIFSSSENKGILSPLLFSYIFKLDCLL